MDEFNRELDSIINERLADLGTPFMMHTADCEMWKLEHENCTGCPNELGCVKNVAIKYQSLIPSFYEPKNYDDFLLMQKRMFEKTSKIFDAKTIDEIKDLL